MAYRKVYESLIDNGLPIVSGTKNKAAKGKAEFFKYCQLSGCFIFFFGFTNFGMLNKIFFAVMTSQVLVFFTKMNFYQSIIDDLLDQMTLSG